MVRSELVGSFPYQAWMMKAAYRPRQPHQTRYLCVNPLSVDQLCMTRSHNNIDVFPIATHTKSRDGVSELCRPNREPEVLRSAGKTGTYGR
jgi:hypothetical protein